MGRSGEGGVGEMKERKGVEEHHSHKMVDYSYY